MDEGELLDRLRAGDAAAFARVVRAWSPAMLRVARAHVRTDAAAEDVVQEAWLAVVRGLPGFEGRALLRTWVFRILVHTACRRGAQDARRPDHPAAPVPTRGPDDEEPWPGHRRDGTGEPESALLAGEVRALLRDALAGLPERQRAVVELRDVHGFAAEEVCSLLDLTPANQRVLLHRGRARLRAALEGHAPPSARRNSTMSSPSAK